MKNKKTIAAIIAICAVVFSSVTYSQVIENGCDTVKIEAPAYLVLNDTSIQVNNDSTAIICKAYIVLTKKNGYALYSKLIGESQKHHLVSKLFQLLIASSTQDTMLLNRQIMAAEEAYTQYSGKVIRSIKIQILKPFGPSISDTNLPVVSTWGKALNNSHINTHKSIIKRKLLFTENDTVNPLELVENTRNLANLPYLQDATIIVNNVAGDSVDVLILVKDKFPWLPAIEVYDINKFSGYLKNVNLMGLGQSVGAGLTFDSKSSPRLFLSDVNYYVDNIYKQISGGANYHISNNEQEYQILLNRDIIPLSIRLGGGLELSQTEQNIVTDPTDIDKSAWFFKYDYFEIWSSYLFYKTTTRYNKTDDHLYIVPGVTLNRRNYLYRPYVSVDSNSMFNNYTNMLTNVALVKQSYYRTNFLKNFGKAEYLPYGFQISITGGYSLYEYSNNPYLGVRMAATKHVTDLGYVFADFEIGSHFSDKLEQGALHGNLSFLSSLRKKGRYRYRLYSKIDYTTGINRVTNDLIYLGEDYGFIGMNKKAWYGQQRLFIEMDVISYTPWYLFGFRFAAFAFGSLGALGSNTHSIFVNQILSSVGVGLYVRNDFLAISSLQVRVAYFPVTPIGISHIGISFSTFGLLSSLNFLSTKPHIVEYQ